MPEFPSFTKVFYHESYPSIAPDRSDLSVEGKTVLIIGAGSGIGQATAVAFARAKAKFVVICGRRSEPLEETKAKISALSGNTEVIIQILDIASEDNVDTVFETVRKQTGSVDIAICCAGHLSEAGSIRNTSVSNFWDSFEINTKGAFLVSRAFLRHCVNDDGKQRVLILCSSFLAHLPAPHVATAPASYCISKLGAAKLAEFIAFENPDTLRAYAIQPGVVPTEMSNRSVEMTPDPEATRSALTWDHVDLPAHFMLWLSSRRGAVVPSGKFLWANWDVDELEARSQQLREDPYMLSMIAGGWPFDEKVKGGPSK